MAIINTMGNVKKSKRNMLRVCNGSHRDVLDQCIQRSKWRNPFDPHRITNSRLKGMVDRR